MLNIRTLLKSTSKRLITGHIIFWIAFGLLVNSIYLDFYGFERGFILRAFSNIIVNMFIFYGSALFVVPYYLKKSQNVVIIGYALGFIIITSLGTFFLNQPNINAISERFGILDLTIFLVEWMGQIVFFIFGVTYALGVYWVRNFQQQSVLKSRQLETELKMLKTQIQPHFLFNTLNNVYTLAYLKDDKAAPAIMNLSKMLRYILYDCKTERVFLQNEINFLHNFIELQALKNTDGHEVTFVHQNIKPKQKIAPLLLLNFFENAFKHGDWDSNPNAWVDISIKVNDQNTMYFRMSNSVKTQKKPPKSNAPDSIGIGLENVQRRLELLYPNKHELSIDADYTNGIFVVNLTIELD